MKMTCLKHISINFNLESLATQSFLDGDTSRYERAEARLHDAYDACYERVRRRACEALVIKRGPGQYVLVTPSVKVEGALQTTYLAAYGGKLIPSWHSHVSQCEDDNVEIYHVVF